MLDGSPDGDGTIDDVAKAVEALHAGGTEALQRFLAGLGDRRAAVEERISKLRRFGLLDAEPRAAQGMPEQLGDFRLIAPLGHGGMGVVYSARQVSVDRRVAIKLIRPELAELSGARERFRREISTVARLQHDGIVRLYSFGEDQGIAWFAMEHVDGVSLDEVLRRLQGKRPRDLTGADLFACVAGADGAARPITVPDLFAPSWSETVIGIVEQAAAALSAAHGQGILHRDLKPSNIMLTASGRVVLLDFGLAMARGADRLTRTGAQIGTVHYMAPEQIRAEAHRIDERTDVYSLGVVLRELITLRPAFEGDALHAVQQRVLTGQARALSRGEGAASRDLMTVCATAMDLAPERRYPSAAALLRDLVNVRQHRPIAARPASWSVRVLRYCQRNRAWTAAAVVAFLAILLTPLVIAWREFGLRRELEATAEDLREEMVRATSNFELAADVLNRMVAELDEEQVTEIPDLRTYCERVLGHSDAFLDSLMLLNPTESAARLRLAEVLLQAGSVRWRFRDTARAEATLSRALELLRPVERGVHADRADVCTMEVLSHLTHVRPAGSPEALEAHTAWLGCIDRIRATGDLAARSPELQEVYSYSLVRLANRLVRNERQRAVAMIEESVAVRRRLAVSQPSITRWLALASSNAALHGVVVDRRDPTRSITAIESHRAVLDEAASLTPKDDMEQWALAESHRHLAFLLDEGKQVAPACEALREAIRLGEPVVARRPSRVRMRRELASWRSGLARFLDDLGRSSESVAELRRNVEFLAASLLLWPQEVSLLTYAIAARSQLARQLARQGGQHDAAEAEFRASTAMARRAVQDLPEVVVVLTAAADAIAHHARWTLQVRRAVEGLVLASEARGLFERARLLGPSQGVSVGSDILFLATMADALLQQHRVDEALVLIGGMGRVAASSWPGWVSSIGDHAADPRIARLLAAPARK
jgi:serine/threonine protein kinase